MVTKTKTSREQAADFGAQIKTQKQAMSALDVSSKTLRSLRDYNKGFRPIERASGVVAVRERIIAQNLDRNASLRKWPFDNKQKVAIGLQIVQTAKLASDFKDDAYDQKQQETLAAIATDFVGGIATVLTFGAAKAKQAGGAVYDVVSAPINEVKAGITGAGLFAMAIVAYLVLGKR